MHFIIAAITAIGGLLWALNSLQRGGLDLNALNPFLWMRRRKWQKKLGNRPVYQLERPLEVACVLLVAVARETGPLLPTDKTRIAGVFQNELHLDERQAAEMVAFADHLLSQGPSIIGDLKKVLTPSENDFSAAQLQSLADMMRTVAVSANPRQQQLISEFEHHFAARRSSRNWQAE